MKINKKSVFRYVQDTGVGNLSDVSLIECLLVALATQESPRLTIDLRSEFDKRDICFSDFYNFAKFHWSTSYLVMLSATAIDGVEEFVAYFDSLNADLGMNSADRQKGRLVSRLYSIFYKRTKFQDLTLGDADALLNLIVDNFDKFKGNRTSADDNLTRRDLKGLVSFMRTIYKANNKSLPAKYLERVIPDVLIKDKGVRISRNKSRLRDVHFQNYSLLVDIHNNYLDTLALKTTKEANSALYALIDYVENILMIERIQNVDELKELLIQGRTGKLRLLHYLEHVKGKGTRRKATHIRDMMIWIMTEYGIESEHGFEPLFDNFEWDRIQRDKLYKKGGGIPSKDETPKAVIPMRVHQLAIDILCDPDYKWAKTLNDQYYVDKKGVKQFNPTLTNLLALLFQLPIRTIQAQVLDSGEGDQHRYDVNALCWRLNESKHAGHWQSKYAANPQRGFLRRDQSLVAGSKEKDADGNLIVRRAYLYINTNKTADRQVAFSDLSGYTIPWHHEEVIKIYERQYQFISKHHQIKKPSSFNKLQAPQAILGGKPTKKMLEIMPERFYLFRCNLNTAYEHKDFPPSKQLITKMWNHLTVEIQKRLDSEGADFTIMDKDKLDKYNRNIGGGNSYLSYLTPHCTRVTGITRLEEHGVPIHIISKLIAGHANIRTTYRYTKHEDAYVDEKISEAQASISAKMEMSLTQDLRSSTVEQARSMAYIPDIYSTSWEVVKERSWNSNSLGVCPNGGTLCEKGHDDNIMFDGVGRCLNCKYLISGKPYLINIWSHVNRLLYKAKELNDAYTSLQADYKALLRDKKKEFQENGRSPEWDNLCKSIGRVENFMEVNSADVELTLTEVYFGNMLFDTVRKLTNTDDDFVDRLGFAECSKFEHMNAIVESESFLPAFERDKELKFKRDTFVENALIAIGEKPLFLRGLTPIEKERALSATAKMIEDDIKNQEGKFLGAVLNIENMLEG